MIRCQAMSTMHRESSGLNFGGRSSLKGRTQACLIGATEVFDQSLGLSKFKYLPTKNFLYAELKHHSWVGPRRRFVFSRSISGADVGLTA